MLKIKNLATNEETIVSKKEAAKYVGKRIGKAAVLGAAEGFVCGMSTRAIMSSAIKLAEKAKTQTGSTAIYIGGVAVSCATSVAICLSVDKVFEDKEKKVLYVCKDNEDDLFDGEFMEEDA